MKVLIACEFSGIVRDAFRAKGHDAWSCDLLPCEAEPYYHLQVDVLGILNNGWDLMIAHPPCTYLANAGLHYLRTRPERKKNLEIAYNFILSLWNAPIEKICIENPTGWLNTNWRKPHQIIQPYDFGEPEYKTTCLWLNGLPPLFLTGQMEKPKPIKSIIRKTGKQDGKIYNYYWRQGKTAKARAKTFPGIAKAMAEQWG